MGDKRKTKYKGMICGPVTKGHTKSTREWCKGKVGVEHVWRYYQRPGSVVAGLAVVLYLKCERCEKQAWRDSKPIRYRIEDAVKALAEESGNNDEIAKANMTKFPLNPRLTELAAICESFGLELTVAVKKKAKDRWFSNPYGTIPIGGNV